MSRNAFWDLLCWIVDLDYFQLQYDWFNVHLNRITNFLSGTNTAQNLKWLWLISIAVIQLIQADTPPCSFCKLLSICCFIFEAVGKSQTIFKGFIYVLFGLQFVFSVHSGAEIRKMRYLRKRQIKSCCFQHQEHLYMADLEFFKLPKCCE